MKLSQVKIGIRVKSNVAFAGVSKGTEAIIDELYDGGFMIAWDLKDRPLPEGYKEFDGVPTIKSGILRDGFDNKVDIKFLDLVEDKK